MGDFKLGDVNPDDNPQHPLADLDRIIHSPARLMVMTYLYVVESADFVFLMQLTGLTWGNLSTHLSKLEAAGYVALVKGYKGKKPNTTASLTEAGREAFKSYKNGMQAVLNDLPD
jgi:DNA-binding MarR family transcriptional regulator